MPLDPQVQDYLKRAAEEGAPPINALSPEEARAQMVTKTAMLGEPQAVERIEDRQVEGPAGAIPVRLYFPCNAGNGDTQPPLPVLVYYHGGGWVIGSIETHDGLCRAIANESGAIVASVDYRLAPEHRFPAAVEDAYAAFCQLQSRAAEFGGDPARIGVGGDSAGGNLAAVVTLLSRDRGGPQIAWQLLAYPATDCDLDSGSYRDFADGFGLNRAEMSWFWDHYVETTAERRPW